MYGVFALNNPNDTNYLPQLYQNDLKHKVTTNIIPLYNIYSTYREIWLVETIPRDIY